MAKKGKKGVSGAEEAPSVPPSLPNHSRPSTADGARPPAQRQRLGTPLRGTPLRSAIGSALNTLRQITSRQRNTTAHSGIELSFDGPPRRAIQPPLLLEAEENPVDAIGAVFAPPAVGVNVDISFIQPPPAVVREREPQQPPLQENNSFIVPHPSTNEPALVIPIIPVDDVETERAPALGVAPTFPDLSELTQPLADLEMLPRNANFVDIFISQVDEWIAILRRRQFEFLRQDRQLVLRNEFSNRFLFLIRNRRSLLTAAAFERVMLIVRLAWFTQRMVACVREYREDVSDQDDQVDDN